MDWNPDQISRKIFAEFIRSPRGPKDRARYKDEYDELELELIRRRMMPEGLAKRISGVYWIKHRRPTLGDYALCIYDNTLREVRLRDYFCEANDVRITKEIGTDNSGLVLIRKQISTNADFRGYFPQWQLELDVETKYGPTLNKFTLGKDQIERALAPQSGAWMLVFFSAGSMVGPNGDPDKHSDYEIDPRQLCYGLIGPKKIRSMLKREFKMHPEYKRDVSTQWLGRGEVMSFFEVQPLTTEFRTSEVPAHGLDGVSDATNECSAQQDKYRNDTNRIAG